MQNKHRLGHIRRAARKMKEPRLNTVLTGETVGINEDRRGTRLQGGNVVAQKRKDGVHSVFVGVTQNGTNTLHGSVL